MGLGNGFWKMSAIVTQLDSILLQSLVVIADVEQRLMAAHSAARSVRNESSRVKFMDVEFAQVASMMRQAPGECNLPASCGNAVKVSPSLTQ